MSGRTGRRRAAAVAVALLAVAALAGLAAGSASTLGVAAAPRTTLVQQAPCAGAASAVASPAGSALATGVLVTLPAGCGSRDVSVTLTSGTSTPVRASGRIDGSGVLATAAAFTPTATMVAAGTVDGWAQAVTWTHNPAISCRVPSAPTTRSCEATVTLFTGVKPGGTGTFTYYDVRVTTTSATPVDWEVTFYLTHPSYGSVPTLLGNSTLDPYSDGQTSWDTNPANDVTRTSACSALPGRLVVEGEDNGPSGNRFSVVSATRPRLFSLVLDYDTAEYRDVVGRNCG